MKRIALVLVMLLLLAGQARAAELPAELAESLPKGAGTVAGTDFQQGITALLDTVGEQLHTLLRRGTAGIVRILLIVVLCGVGESLLQPLQEKNAFRYVTLAGTAAIVAVAAGDLTSLMGLGVETMAQLSQFSKALLPTLAAATAAMGMAGTASVKQVATVFFSDVLISVIQGLFISTTGPWGILMHIIATGMLVLVAGSIYRVRHTRGGAILGLVLGTLAMGLVMMPANHFITPVWMGAPVDVVDGLMLVGILPFNLLKAGINSGVTFVVYKLVSRYLIHGDPFAVPAKKKAEATH